MILQLDGQPTEFWIDTGTDVIIIPKEMYIGTTHESLQKVQSRLSGPNLSTVQVKGLFTGKLKLDNRRGNIRFLQIEKSAGRSTRY